jgi:hypothetical protein
MVLVVAGRLLNMYVSTSTTPRKSLVNIQRSGRTIIYYSTFMHLTELLACI